MAFDQDFIERVRNAHNIVDYISSFTTLKRSGSTYMGLCPFPSHREKTPSFSVSEDKQIYHCFGCHKGGNLITFLMEYQGMTFPQAVEALANRAGIPIPEEASPDNQKKRDEKSDMVKINAFAKDQWFKELKRLPESSPVKTYLKKRRLSAEIIEEFELGWAPDSWNFTVQNLVSHKFPMNLGEAAGLVRRKEARFYDYFRARLMFPIVSNTGEVLGFGGRCLGDENPKYLNSPDTPLFNKGKVLFGLNHSAKHIRAEDQVIVVEGYMDFLALYQVGIKNVVAVLGTALTHDHCRLISRFSKNVLVLFDGDSAGIRAAERSLGILLANDLLPKWCLLPDEFDPDEFIQERGKSAFLEALQKSDEMFLGLLSHWMKDFSYQNYEKIQILQKVAPILQAVKNQPLRELYLGELCLRLRVENSWLLKALDQNKQQMNAEINPQTPVKTSSVKAPEAQEKVSLKGLSKAELDLLGLMLKSPDYLTKLDQESVMEVASANFGKIVGLAKNYLAHFPDDFNKLAGYISSMVDTPSIVTQYEKRSSSIADAKTEQKLFLDCVNWIRSQKYKEKAKEMLYKLQQGAGPQELEQFMNINKKKHGILST